MSVKKKLFDWKNLSIFHDASVYKKEPSLPKRKAEEEKFFVILFYEKQRACVCNSAL